MYLVAPHSSPACVMFPVCPKATRNACCLARRLARIVAARLLWAAGFLDAFLAASVFRFFAMRYTTASLGSGIDEGFRFHWAMILRTLATSIVGSVAPMSAAISSTFRPALWYKTTWASGDSSPSTAWAASGCSVCSSAPCKTLARSVSSTSSPSRSPRPG